MTEPELPLDDLRPLAEQELAEKRQITGNPEQAADLYDLPASNAATLAPDADGERS